MGKLKGLREVLTDEEISSMLTESFPDTGQEIEFEVFLQVLCSFLFIICISVQTFKAGIEVGILIGRHI